MNEDLGRHTVRFPNSRHYVPVARRTALEFARSLGLPAECEEDLTYAVGEALANAVEHGFRERTYFSVRCWRDNDVAIIVEVEDDGTGFDPDAPNVSDEIAERGYGISIMRSMVDEVSFQRNGRLVRLHKYLHPRSGPLDEVESA